MRSSSSRLCAVTVGMVLLSCSLCAAPQATVGTPSERAARILKHQEQLDAAAAAGIDVVIPGEAKPAKPKRSPPAPPAPEATAGGVDSLTPQNYLAFLKTDNFKFVKFLAPW